MEPRGVKSNYFGEDLLKMTNFNIGSLFKSHLVTILFVENYYSGNNCGAKRRKSNYFVRDLVIIVNNAVEFRSPNLTTLSTII